MLNKIETQQNERFFSEFLHKHFSGVTVSPNAITSFLANCQHHAIWLPGLSPIVQKEFISVLTLAITQKAPNFNIAFAVLTAAIQQERHWLQNQFANHGGNHNQAGFQSSLADHEGAGKRTRDAYWLQAEDITAATLPLAQQADIFVHAPVAAIDDRITETVTHQLQHGGAKVAYVPISHRNGHWMLETYHVEHNNMTHQHYNPPGDGKCGDHVVNKMYTDAASRQLYHGPIGLIGRAETPHTVRQQTIALITAPSATPNKRSQSTITSDRADQPYTVSGGHKHDGSSALDPITQPPRLFGRSTFDQLCDAWNRRANSLIDTIQHYSEQDRATAWHKFTQAAETNGIIAASDAPAPNVRCVPGC